MPGSGFVFAAFEYPCITIKEIIVYILLLTQAPIPVCLDGTIIDSRTIYTRNYVLLWLCWGMISGCAW